MIITNYGARYELGPPTVARAGRGCFYTDHLVLIRGERVSLGDAVSFNHGCWINAAGGLTVGDRVLFGPRVMVHTANHVIDDPSRPIREQGHRMAPVEIGDDCWIGMGSLLLPGVGIGEGSVVAAGSVVTRDVSPWSVVAGNPARLVRDRRGSGQSPV